MLSNTFISLSSHQPVLDLKYIGLKSTHYLLGSKKLVNHIPIHYPNPLSQSKSFSKNEKPLNVWFRLQSLVIDLANALKYILSPYSHIICLTLNIMVLKTTHYLLGFRSFSQIISESIYSNQSLSRKMRKPFMSSSYFKVL
jgi:hypothetical protein